MRHLVRLVATLAVGVTLGLGPAVGVSSAAPIGAVKIAGATYAWGDAGAFASYAARAPAAKLALSVIRKCPNVKLYGFINLNRGAGVVGWAPTSLLRCLPVAGGGPGAGPSGCVQAMKTQYPDPYHLSGLNLSAMYVLLAASSDASCRDLSTQLPGGVWMQTTTAFNGIPAGAIRVIKCQASTTDGLWDFVASYSNTLPQSKAAVWIPHRYMNTNVNRLLGVPDCWG